MTLSGILSSPTQRRSFILTSSVLLGFFCICIFLIAYFAPPTPIWSAFSNLFISFVASACFALTSGLFVIYFFVDPNDLSAELLVLPEDIGQTLNKIAENAVDYKIFVRTGRHFRAEILPKLVDQARKFRRPIQIEVILLDFRDSSICEKYASYRRASSFDRQLWNTGYVKKEVLATIFALINASRDNVGLVEIHLYLSKRLSIFRIEGSADALLITREDPKDSATRYVRSHRNFAAFLTEFRWIQNDSYQVPNDLSRTMKATLEDMFVDDVDVLAFAVAATEASKSGSPYVR